jgi:hypothetical protein
VATIWILTPDTIAIEKNVPTDAKVFAAVRYQRNGDVGDYFGHYVEFYNNTYAPFRAGQVITHTPTNVAAGWETILMMDLLFTPDVAKDKFSVKIVNGDIDPADSNGYAYITLYDKAQVSSKAPPASDQKQKAQRPRGGGRG